jgi:hypothetical protein
VIRELVLVNDRSPKPVVTSVTDRATSFSKSENSGTITVAYLLICNCTSAYPVNEGSLYFGASFKTFT